VARRGVFGRRPRAAPSLTATIVAIAQAMQAAQDRNIMDAWQNGGTVRDPKTGEQVAAEDEYVLAHWRGRLEKISPKDPLYDQYSNTVTQFEYAVEESKNSLLYAQGKIGDGARAQFFLNWSKKIDPDTEFYRTLQRNAAQFLQRARSGGGGGGGGRAAASAKADAATYNQYEAVAKTLTSWLTQLAQDESFIGGTEDLDDLTFGANHGPGRMIELIGKINNSPVAMERLRALDPSLTGLLTYEYYMNTLQSQSTGLGIRYQRAIKDGRTTDAKKIQGEIDDQISFAGKSGLWDTAQMYLASRRSFLQVWDDPYASPDAKIKAWSAYRGRLLELASDPNNPVDGATKTTLEGEANLNPLIDSWYENFTRSKSVGASATSGDNADTRASVQVFLKEYQSVNDGTGKTVWTYGERSSKGVFTPKAGGSLIGATSAALAEQANAKMVLVPQVDGTSIAVQVAPVKVFAIARNEFGEDLDAMRTRKDGSSTRASSQIGIVLNVWTGYNMEQVYGYEASDGTMRYTMTPIWKSLVQGKDGYEVDLSASVQAGAGAIKDQKEGSPSFGETVGFSVSKSWDPIRKAAGVNEATDFVTPLLAVMSATPEGREQLKNVNQDPRLRQLIVNDFAKNSAALAPEAQAVAYTRFLSQLTQSGSRFVGTFVGVGAEYDNRTNIAAWEDDKIAPPAKIRSEPVGEFAPLAKAMTVPGRLVAVNYGPNSELRQGVEIMTPISLTLPAVPQLNPSYTGAAPGQAQTPEFTPLFKPTPIAPIEPLPFVPVAPGPEESYLSTFAEPTPVPLFDEYYGGSPPPLLSR
jgi:hypothetical protein